MNNIKNVFSIKDLENLSGIKAHTIRIWEKRYNMLQPMRTQSNIRLYDLKNLQKLLNIVFLHKQGYKISIIASYNYTEITSIVREVTTDKNIKNLALHSFKLAMLTFDENAFRVTYQSLILHKTDQAIFYDVIIPLMEEIGFLWQSDTITPAHDHFISYLIRQKIIINTEKAALVPPTNIQRVYVLFLPDNEMHELGLLYINYQLISKGYKTIYLGQSIPTESLQDILNYFTAITFVTYSTVYPVKDEINTYLQNINLQILAQNNANLWITGRMTNEIDKDTIPDTIKIFPTLEEIIQIL